MSKIINVKNIRLLKILMKRLLIVLAVVMASCGIALQAQNYSKMSSWLIGKTMASSSEARRAKLPAERAALRHSSYVLTMVQTTDADVTLRRHACAVVDHIGDVYFAFVPTDELAALSEQATITRLEANAPAQPRLDVTAATIGADKAYYGSGMSQAYTGSGVAVAVLDIGFDFMHPMFRNPDGTSAISWFWDMTAPSESSSYIGKVYNTSAQLLDAKGSALSASNYHGAHVMGIAAGRGVCDNKYRGIAYDSQILGVELPMGSGANAALKAVGQFIRNQVDAGELPAYFKSIDSSDAAELLAYKTIFEQTDQAGVPCVINCSWGRAQNLYQNDNLYETVFNSIVGPGHIVTFAAGNEGSSKVYERKKADETFIDDLVFNVSGSLSLTMRCAAEAPDATVTIAIGNDDNNSFTFKTSDVDARLLSHPDSPEVQGTINDEMATEDGETAHHDITIVGGKSGAYRRYYIAIVLSDYTRENAEAPLNGMVKVVGTGELELMGAPDGIEFMSDDYEQPEPHMGRYQYTINIPASLERAIAVGMMNRRNKVANTAGKQVSYLSLYEGEGHLASISSCGPTVDGRVKPDVVAPGNNIVSAMSSQFVSQGSGEDRITQASLAQYRVAHTTLDGTDYYLNAYGGTSMATPVMSGVIALWLQANPNLSPEDIQGVISRTSRMPSDAPSTGKNNEYGWGEVDAYAGLLDILGLSSVPDIIARRPLAATIMATGGGVCVSLQADATAPFEVVVYSVNGTIVARRTFGPGSATYVLDFAAAPGVYAVQINSDEAAIKGSELIRF